MKAGIFHAAAISAALLISAPAMSGKWGGSSGGHSSTGGSTGSSSGGHTNVPAPSAILLFGLGAAGLMIGRRIRR